MVANDSYKKFGEKEGAPPTPSVINRGSALVMVSNAYGEDFSVEVNEGHLVAQVKSEIAARTTVGERFQVLSQGGRVLEDGCRVAPDSPVQLSYRLDGGGLEIETKIPDLIAQNFLCFHCDAMKGMPDWENEDFAIGECFCFKTSCGFADCWKLQFLPLVLSLKPFGFEVDKGNPIKIQCLVYKCGLQPLMDITKEDFMTGVCFCIQENVGFGPNHDMKLFQCFCLKFQL